MERLLTPLSRIEQRLIERRAAVIALSDQIDLLRNFGAKCLELEIAAVVIEIKIARLSKRRAMLTRVLRRSQSRRRVTAR